MKTGHVIRSSKPQLRLLRQSEADFEPSFERCSKCFLRVCRMET
uniref:Uncharacterized protein n=1 Tax=Rhizophora mucronata TaxID=61149 RepID=A0A2P2NYD4_RHIMU